MKIEHKPRLLRGILRGGEARFLLCDTTALTQQARDIHYASNTCTAAMGRLLTGTAMMGSNLESEGDRLTVTIKGGGPAGTLCAVAVPDGCVKVTIDHPEVELPLREDGKLNVGGAVGKDGQLSVMRSYGFGEPYMGRVALVSGEIAQDFAQYFVESEQVPSLCALGVRIRENVEAAGGILIQAMPNCSDKLLDDLDIRTELFSAISQLLEEMTLEEIVENCFRGLEPEILEDSPLALCCDCSLNYVEKVLLSMGKEELKNMIEEQGSCEVCCHFCRKKYFFDRAHLERLLEEGTQEENT